MVKLLADADMVWLAFWLHYLGFLVGSGVETASDKGFGRTTGYASTKSQ